MILESLQTWGSGPEALGDDIQPQRLRLVKDFLVDVQVGATGVHGVEARIGQVLQTLEHLLSARAPGDVVHPQGEERLAPYVADALVVELDGRLGMQDHDRFGVAEYRGVLRE